MNKSEFKNLVKKLQTAEIEAKTGNPFCDGNSIIKNRLNKISNESNEFKGFVRLYWDQVVEVSYIMADINWGRQPKDKVVLVDEELIDREMVTNMMYFSNRDFDGDFSTAMSSGKFGKLD